VVTRRARHGRLQARAVARLFLETANASTSQRSDPCFRSHTMIRGGVFRLCANVPWCVDIFPVIGQQSKLAVSCYACVTGCFFIRSCVFCPGRGLEESLAQGPWRTRDAESRVGPVDSEPAQGSGPRGSRQAGQRPAFEGTGRAQAHLSVFARQSSGSPQAREQWLGRTQGPPPTKWCHLPGQPGTNWERWTSGTICSQGPLTANKHSQR
jgi:hypothetical protein